MASSEHRYGDCHIVVQARLVGDQPVKVQGVTAVASRTGREHLALTVGRVLLYLQDRAALDALVEAVRRAGECADGVFGAVPDAFSQAERREAVQIAKTAGCHSSSRARRVALREGAARRRAEQLSTT